MSSIECFHPTIHRKHCSRAFSNLCDFQWSTLLRSQSRRLNGSLDPSVSNPLSVPSTVPNISWKFGFWGGIRKNNQIRGSGVPASTRDNSPNRRSEFNQRRGNWWWWWEQLMPSREFGVLLLQFGLMMLVMRLVRPGSPLAGAEPKARPVTHLSVPYSEFLGQVSCDQVEKVEVSGVRINFKLRDQAGSGDGDEYRAATSNLQELGPLAMSQDSIQRIVYTTTRPVDIKTPYEKMVDNGVEFGKPDKQSDRVLNTVLISLFGAAMLLGFLHQSPVSFSKHGASQLKSWKSLGSGRLKVSKQGEGIIKFSDVAGVDEAKEELEEIVEFLRNPDRYIRVGARPPRGILLVGPPGTGKTLLAKAVAGEAEVPFISCPASEFIEMYIGMGASRVRDLFARAKKEAPSIIFIDEIDAVAKNRDGKFRLVSNDEREQTLNQLLTEMDGFESSPAVIVLGATNRADVLDPALCRPGRFDRVVMVESPDRTGREAILKVHVSKNELPLEEDVDLSDIASMTPGFTGADLANLVNEAALLAGRQNKLVVQKIDFVNAVERSIAGVEKKTVRLHGSEKAVIARHEAGHAIVGTAVANLLPGQPQVEKLSILPRSGGALGFTYTPMNEDRYLLFMDELWGRLAILLGGRAAEQVAYSGRVSTGAIDDIRKATDIAYKAVAEYGLNCTVGPVSLVALSGGGIDQPPGILASGMDQGHLIDLVQREVKELLQSALDVAISVVRANPSVLEGLGARLEEDEKVEGEELRKWLDSVVVPSELAAFIRGHKKQGLFN
ncbi:ATP-dependent zinc metalloprotease FTSH 9, chloroplastic isoform X1 [Punica granatum]|uniref:ATP-dependent zinc metalloprotease FTSH 9, chloroplastic isoform X1 n=2 Tax=Punica granatum TaxID=22663 RepID=A0A6P8CW93_PUNGR|nr:ATP-dependent zinc metalloprotease FTSH 9, chloroplastic isoform X1 [Punica granatum]